MWINFLGIHSVALTIYEKNCYAVHLLKRIIISQWCSRPHLPILLTFYGTKVFLCLPRWLCQHPGQISGQKHCVWQDRVIVKCVYPNSTVELKSLVEAGTFLTRIPTCWLPSRWALSLSWLSLRPTARKIKTTSGGIWGLDNKSMTDKSQGEPSFILFCVN